MKMYSKNIVRSISMLEDIYVIVIAVISPQIAITS